MTEEYVRYFEEMSAIHSTLQITGWIQFEVLTTLPLRFEVFCDKIENLNHTIRKDIKFGFL